MSPGGDSDLLADERLACGRSAEDLLAQVADGHGDRHDAHQQHCPHCQAALGEYDRLWAPVRDLAAQHISAPDSVVESALRRIRGAVEHTDHAILESAQGVTRIAARVIVVTARKAAQGVPGVRVALSKKLADRAADSQGSRGAAVAAGVAGRSTAIKITLAADYGIDLNELGERVRRHVAARVRTLTDLDPVQVTVVIDDVFPT